MNSDQIVVMVNGLPGKMAGEVCNQIVKADKIRYPFKLYESSLTGLEISAFSFTVDDGFTINLFTPGERSQLVKGMTWYKDRSFIVVDFSHPSAVIENAKFYCFHKIPFIMETTGGDQKKLVEMVKASQTCAVIAPNMAKEVVTFLAMMEFATKNFPGVFRGYTLRIEESHQNGKVDTSGTAKAMAGYFNSLGIPFFPSQIEKVRNPKKQRAMGVPEKALSAHGWHTYSLRSPDGSVFFQFTHNVNGREVYALGTLDAINFLAKNIQPGAVYSMADVLIG
ncbi:MAG: dihydrodipicolinate reductase C-terminal domain-containing protein [Parcubacteria group bacterium]